MNQRRPDPRRRPALIAVDLDQTVVFSRRSAGETGPSVVVEHLDGAPLSSMTTGGHRAYAELASRHTVVPVTTRTVAQYQRITLPSAASWAVCANGGVLLADGARDQDWDRWVAANCAQSAPLAEVQARLRAVEQQDWVRLVRTAQDLFCYLVAHRRDDIPPRWLVDLEADLEPVGWQVSVQGRKVYAVPTGLSKAAAIERLADRLGADVLLAAGDSLLDLPLLELAVSRGGAAVRPAHGELHELAYAGAHVTTQTGARAGEELLRWLAVRADELAPASPAEPNARHLP